MTETILVTGAHGTLGQPLVRELRSRGYRVYGIDATHCADPNCIRADIGNARQVAAAINRVGEPIHHVYHLAAEFGRNNGEEFSEQLWVTNCVGTRNMLDAACRVGARFYFASSSEVYGENAAPFLTEELTDSTSNFHNEYAISKFTNELQVRNFQKRHPEFSATVLRFFNAYGPGEIYHPYRSVVSLFCHRAMHGEQFEVYQGYHRTFMYVGDFIPTLANVADADLKESTYNIGGADFRNVEELAELVISETGASRDLVRLLPTEAHNVVSKRPDITRARRDLGHDPCIKIEAGVLY
jgi:dTDP-glucose 4,6-dehydratase